MAWRDNLLPGKLNNVPFEYRVIEQSGGRRAEVHEHAGRDNPFVEDLGRMPREFRVQAFVIGENYASAREELIDQLESKGPLQFQNPYRGIFTVNVVGDYKLTEDIENGRMAIFEFTLVESGFSFVTLNVPTPAKISSITNDLKTKLASKTKLKVLGAIGLVLSSIARGMQRASSAVRKVNGKISAQLNLIDNITQSISDFDDEITTLLATPKVLVGKFIALGTAVINLVKNFVPPPKEVEIDGFEPDTVAIALAALETFFVFNTTSDTISTQSEQSIIEIDGHKAISLTTQAQGLASVTEALVELELESSNQAIDILKNLGSKFDTLIAEDFDNEVLESLISLKAAVIEHFTKVAISLPQIRPVEVVATVPVLRLAYDVYGDALQDENIIKRNRIRHPAFVAGGQTLEFLVSNDEPN